MVVDQNEGLGKGSVDQMVRMKFEDGGERESEIGIKLEDDGLPVDKNYVQQLRWYAMPVS